MTTVLVIEDERHIADVVRIALERDGHHAVCVRTGGGGLAELTRHQVALVVLDIGLPGMDGLEVCRRIRARLRSLPVIMLTARDEEADRVAGLELGADDYVPKPFSPRELAARVKAVLRRGPPPPASTPTSGSVTSAQPRPSRRPGGRRGRGLARPTEFELVAFLMENPGLLFRREACSSAFGGSTSPVAPAPSTSTSPRCAPSSAARS